METRQPAMLTTPPVHTEYDAMTAVEHVIMANGNMPLAAERMHFKNEGDLITLIANDPEAHDQLMRRLRVLVQMQVYGAVSQVQLALIASLESLEPADTAKLYTALLTTFDKLTATSSNDMPLNKNDIEEMTRAIAIEHGVDPEEAVAAVMQAEKLIRRSRLNENTDS